MNKAATAGFPGILERLSAKTFFFLVFFYQLLFIFQGIDVSDEGFNATFYQLIFRDPVSVQYNFMFWLSGVIGGAWTSLFSWMGMLGIRLGGVLATTATIILCHNLLKRYLNVGYMRLGLVLVLLFVSNDTKELYYNNLSALFYLIIATLLMSGLRDSKNWKLFVAGAMIALNVFIRLPSAMGVGLAIAIFYYGYLNKTKIAQQLKQLMWFAFGGIVGTGFVFVLMVSLGHLDVFLNCLNWVINLSQSKAPAATKAVDSSGYYGIMTQVKTFVTGISLSLRYTIFTLLFALGCMYAERYVRPRAKKAWIMPVLNALLIILLCIAVLRGSKIFNFPNLVLLYIYSGLTILTAAIVLLGSSSKEMKLLMFIGAYITITYPMGSRGGITSAGIYSFWLAFPIVINYLFSITGASTNNYLLQSVNNLTESFSLSINSDQFNKLRRYALVICLFGCLYSAYYFPFSDLSNRARMFYTIDNEHLRGVLTTKERATVLNELMTASSQYIQPGDTILAYDAIPLIHYMTDTKPYLKNSYPWLYTIPVLTEELEKAQQEKALRPVVIQHYAATISHRSVKWPSNSVEEFTEWNKERILILDSFLIKNNYKEVWHNSAFRILISPK